MKTKTLTIVTVLAGSMLVGCASYYRVTDPHTNEVYYTDKLDRQNSGVIRFKDSKTGNDMTLAASQVQEIPKEEYDVGRYQQQMPQQQMNQQQMNQQPTTRPAGQ